jgi:hypothetical protein
VSAVPGSPDFASRRTGPWVPLIKTATPWQKKIRGVEQAQHVADLTGVSANYKMTPVVKTQVYLGREELEALHQVADRSDRSVADLIREAIRRVWLRPTGQGPVALWDGPPQRASVDHDSIYDNP